MATVPNPPSVCGFGRYDLNAVGADEVVETDDDHRGFRLSEHGPDSGDPILVSCNNYGSIEFWIKLFHLCDPVRSTSIFSSRPVGVEALSLIVTGQNLIENVSEVLNFLCG
jgi:hypothetical protein